MSTQFASDAGTTVDNDGFWPDIHSQTVAAVLALNHSLPPVRLEQAVLDAMAALNTQLRSLKQRYRAEGYNTLAQVPPERNGTPMDWPRLYRRALYCAVGAQLCKDRNRPLSPTSADYQRGAAKAVGQLLGNAQPVEAQR